MLFNLPELKGARIQYIETHNKDIPHAKFKIGEKVYLKDWLPDVKMGGIIEAISDTGDGIEYMIKNMGVLYWEEELTKIE